MAWEPHVIILRNKPFMTNLALVSYLTLQKKFSVFSGVSCEINFAQSVFPSYKSLMSNVYFSYVNSNSDALDFSLLICLRRGLFMPIH